VKALQQTKEKHFNSQRQNAQKTEEKHSNRPRKSVQTDKDTTMAVYNIVLPPNVYYTEAEVFHKLEVIHF
jgi:hypothetical protein